MYENQWGELRSYKSNGQKCLKVINFSLGKFALNLLKQAKMKDLNVASAKVQWFL